MDFLGDIWISGKNFLVDIAVFGAIFFAVEKIRPAEKGVGFLKPEFREEAGIAVFNRFLTLPLFTFVISIEAFRNLSAYVPYHVLEPFILTWPLEIQILFGLFILDFSTYWRHRMMHKFFWPVHSTHHSAKHLTWITGLRLHPIEVIISALFDTAFLYVLGFEGEAIAAVNTAMVAYNFYLHSNIDVKYPKPLRWLFASPHFHRWHHATEKAAYDKNFCSFFSCLDLMFGTYYHPENELPSGYGLSPKDQKAYPTGDFFAQLAYPLRKVLPKKKK